MLFHAFLKNIWMLVHSKIHILIYRVLPNTYSMTQQLYSCPLVSLCTHDRPSLLKAQCSELASCHAQDTRQILGTESGPPACRTCMFNRPLSLLRPKNTYFYGLICLRHFDSLSSALQIIFFPLAVCVLQWFPAAVCKAYKWSAAQFSLPPPGHHTCSFPL